MSAIQSPFSSWLIISVFTPMMIVFRRFFTRIARGVSLILVIKADVFAVGLYHQCNQTIQVTDGDGDLTFC
jgi:hypothetical protein